MLATAMAELGVQLHLGERVERCETADSLGSVSLWLRSGAALHCDDVLVCAGRTSNTQQLDRKTRGATLTPLRRQVLELVLDAQSPVGAYALLDRLKVSRPGAAPRRSASART